MIGSRGLNFRVRDGNGCGPSDRVTGNSFTITKPLVIAANSYQLFLKYEKAEH
jgi:hypothetical protein